MDVYDLHVYLPNVFIMGYVTPCLGCCMVCCNNCFISGGLVYIVRCFHLYSFASYDLPYALKIKYLMAKGYQYSIHVHLIEITLS